MKIFDARYDVNKNERFFEVQTTRLLEIVFKFYIRVTTFPKSSINMFINDTK